MLYSNLTPHNKINFNFNQSNYQRRENPSQNWNQGPNPPHQFNNKKFNNKKSDKSWANKGAKVWGDKGPNQNEKIYGIGGQPQDFEPINRRFNFLPQQQQKANFNKKMIASTGNYGKKRQMDASSLAFLDVKKPKGFYQQAEPQDLLNDIQATKPGIYSKGKYFKKRPVVFNPDPNIKLFDDMMADGKKNPFVNFTL
jgi:hypothetical protein